MGNTALHGLIGLSVIVVNASITKGVPVVSNDYWESSGDSEETAIFTTSLSDSLTKSVQPTSVVEEKPTPPFLNQVLDFLQENRLLIIVIATLLLLLLTITCSAIILSRRRKVSVYYPCAFPSKMYVDERDKTGGVRLFSEVPEKVNTAASNEPVNSAKQLQEDIMLATKNLRTPVKAAWKVKDETVEEHDKKIPQCDADQEESHGMLEQKLATTSVDEGSTEMSGPRRSQDIVPVCGMEKTDLSDPGPPEESKHPSEPENPEIQTDLNKQEVSTSSSSFISEEKTAF